MQITKQVRLSNATQEAPLFMIVLLHLYNNFQEKVNFLFIHHMVTVIISFTDTQVNIIHNRERRVNDGVTTGEYIQK